MPEITPADNETADNDPTLEAVVLAAILRSIRKVLRLQANAVQDAAARYVESGATGASLAIDIERVLSESFTPDSFISAFVQETFDPVFTGYAVAAEEQMTILGISINEDGVLFSPSVLSDINAQIARTATLVENTIRMQVQDLIAKSLADVEDLTSLARKIAALIDDPHRAMLIARTERTGAMAGGRYAAADTAFRQGVVVGKKWNTVLDGRERDTHLRQNGQVVQFDARFANGGRFPGDPLLPASEVCNCRCAVSFVRRGTPEGDALTASLIDGGERWWGLLCEIDSPTSDGRILTGDVTWRMLNLPYFFQPEQDDAHDGAVQVGVIDRIEVVRKSVFGYGYLFPEHPLHDRALEVLASDSAQLSVDPAEAQVYEGLDGTTIYLDPVLSGVTMTAGPAAFGSTRAYLEDPSVIEDDEDEEDDSMPEDENAPDDEQEDATEVEEDPADMGKDDKKRRKKKMSDELAKKKDEDIYDYTIDPALAEQVLYAVVPLDCQEDYIDLTALHLAGWPAHFATVALNERSREQMPVVEPDQVQGFLDYLAAEGVAFEVISMDPRSLSAGQNELNAVKVAAMCRSKRDESFDEAGLAPLVSRDFRVLDGHHRWAADTIIRHADGDMGVDVGYTRIDMTWPDLVMYADDYAAHLGNEGKDVTAAASDDVAADGDAQDVLMASIVIDNAFKAAEVAIVEVREADAFLAEHASIVASGPLTFDAAAFKDRKFTAATPITIDADGNVFGHAALWSQCHRGITGRCQLAPRDTDGYKHFNLRRIETTEGPIMVGQLTAGIGHAPHGLSATGTMEHYDNTDAIWAFVRAYDDRFGIAVVGKVLPDVSPERLARVGHTLSGDWRKIENRLRMVALLSVPVPGFAITASMMADEIEDLDSVQATFGLFDDDGVEPLELDADETCAPCDERRAAAMARIAEQRRAFAMSKVSAHRRAGALKALAASLG